MKRLTLKEICAVIAHAEAIQADPKSRDVRITVEVHPLRIHGVGIGFHVWVEGKLNETLVIESYYDLEGRHLTTVQEVMDLMTDTVNEVLK
jgi:hypothetical protein